VGAVHARLDQILTSPLPSRALGAARPHACSVPDVSDRRKSWGGRSVSPRATSDKNLYANDPFYRHLTLTRVRYYRGRRKQADNAQRRKRAQEPEFRDKARARRYGLSLQEYRAILARQGHACAICERSDRPLCVDHCHATGKVRGFLCRECNLGLGYYNDDPSLTRAATAYLEAARRSGE
jgi:Recombination endonuclease VII